MRIVTQRMTRDFKIGGLLVSAAAFANDIKSKGRQAIFFSLNSERG